MSSSSPDYDEIIKKMTNEVIDEIERDIENKMIEFGQQKMDVNPIIQKHENKLKQNKMMKQRHEEPTLEQVRLMKQSKLMELKHIEMHEDQLKKSAVMNASKVSSNCAKLKRSNFTEEQMIEIKKIIHNKNKFEKELKKKQEDLQMWLQNKRVQEQELKKQFIAEQCQQRRKQLKKQREEFEKKKMEHKIQLQQQIKKLQQLKSKKLLHQQLSQSWQKYQQASQQQKQRAWEQQKLRRKFDSSKIKDHEVKYLQQLKEQEKKRQKVLQQSRSLKHHLPYIHSSIFYKVQKEEQQKLRMEEIKAHQRQDNVTKKLLYGKQVKELFLPKVKSPTHREEERKGQMAPPRKHTLNIEESYRLGNDYMKTAHEKVTHDQIDKLKNSLIVLEEPGGYSNHYKNYLKQLKSQHQKENKQSTLQIVESTLKNKHLNSTDKLHKVKMIFQKDKGTKKTDKQLIEAIKSKMKVLQQIVK